MPLLFSYLLKVSVSLGLAFLFYRLILCNLTFYTWNRWYLLAYSILSFFIPLVNIAAFVARHEAVPARLINYVPVLDNYAANSLPLPPVIPKAIESGLLNNWDGLLLVFLLGAAILSVKVMVQILAYSRFRKAANLVKDEGIKIYQVNQNIAPFSFGRSVFINHQLHSPAELKEIIRHEMVHVRQGHTLDIFWGEMMCILNWYNPFAWLLRHSLRQNLEFIADNKVIQSGIDKKQYQYSLLKVIGAPEFQIGSQFNIVSLKKRIAMMNKMPSTSAHLLKFLFVLPLLAASLLAFRGVTQNKFGLPQNDRSISHSADKNAHNAFVIMVDAAHGGHDAGSKLEDGTSEKEITLSIAREIQKAGKEKGIDILLTRKEDESLGIKERLAVAEKLSADLFISLHIGFAQQDKSKSGIECYISESNAAFKESRLFSDLVIQELQTLNGILVNGTKSSNYAILKHNRTPALIMELGYLSNQRDQSFLSNRNNQKALADKIVSSILKFKG
jgi:N-acetylmuramoyl-L-alanine amidase